MSFRVTDSNTSAAPPPFHTSVAHLDKTIPIEAVAVVIGVAIVVIVGLICFFLWKLKRKRDIETPITVEVSDNNTSPLHQLDQGVKMFSYEQLVKATDDFASTNLLGRGGFGYVHKGVLEDGTEVAVKKLKEGSRQGDGEFQAEIQSISRVHHRNLVSLVGYCISGSQRLLVYEFVPNKTLEFHLRDRERPVLEWEKRIKIALGSAKGLAFLHEDCNPRIIHRDIKSANILIDDTFEAKVADFGLARSALDDESHVTTRVMGTRGYMAPDYASSGQLSEKSDVFSFGVVLLELITGRKPIVSSADDVDILVDTAKPMMLQALSNGGNFFDGLVDPRLLDYDANEMMRVIACASASVCSSARDRPKMSQIVRVLQGSLSLSDLTEGVNSSQSFFQSFRQSSEYNSAEYKEDTMTCSIIVPEN
ncbi:Protein kinase domain-containing protein [Hirschfeldia incana]|nr:Protein kinase domain-containing protein [Hirschfeldia incana]